MSKKFDKLRENWKSAGYNGMLMLPIKTEISIKGGERHIITHRGVSFVWINGNEKCYPLVLIPLKNYSLHGDMSSYDYGAYQQFLEYISLIALVYRNTQIDILHRSFKNYFSHAFETIETIAPFYPRPTNTFVIEKQEFKTKHDLTNKENLILSLFRDGNAVENIFHSYLSYFRIFEFLLLKEATNKKGYKKNDWSDFYKWIDTSISRIKSQCLFDSPGLGDYDMFMGKYQNSKKSSVGSYLVDNCRNAIAHGKLGKNKKIKSQNNYHDYLEMYYARNYIRAAAVVILKEEISTDIVIRNLR